jgi:ABC-type molybdate transport system substrate-binding protein
MAERSFGTIYMIILLKFSKHKKIAKDLMNFTVSKEGQKIMKRYGF